MIIKKLTLFFLFILLFFPYLTNGCSDYKYNLNNNTRACIDDKSIEALHGRLLSDLFFSNSYEVGDILSNEGDRNSIKIIINIVSLDFITKQDYPHIKKWFTTALENNPYETIIALRGIYKDDIYFHDKNVERYLKNLYQEALRTY